MLGLERRAQPQAEAAVFVRSSRLGETPHSPERALLGYGALLLLLLLLCVYSARWQKASL
ncbi:hypothetical protein CC78DRAFT_534911 [Lojkania enalia]|uniref:Uncharacterized protein n=1 Tax=Lojkania enalia TaxID=147567 RepID=A0A9P4K3S9_9PLEO|nr:hypothetical protein CC78DRAFT_534911 [Didymosphaeria enalia]